MSKIKVTVWSEGLPASQPHAQKCYPNDINSAIAAFLKEDPALDVSISSLEMDECGLSQELIDKTEVLVLWAHLYHDQVTDEAADRVATAVLQRGMGLVILHSGLFSKIPNIHRKQKRSESDRQRRKMAYSYPRAYTNRTRRSRCP